MVSTMEDIKKYQMIQSVEELDSTLKELDQDGHRYIFRGQSNSGQPNGKEWELHTTFERAAAGLPAYKLASLEAKVMFEFKRQAHHYINRTPVSKLEWLALMQHYGCPTRLLDFTRSYWVALFFALDGATDNASLWVFDETSQHEETTHAEKNVKLNIPREYDGEAANEVRKILSLSNYEESQQIVLKNSKPDGCGITPGIVIVEPKYMNDRLRIQQGVFTFPKDITKSYMENLSSSGINSTQIIIPRELHMKLIARLQYMNITSSTLFPGLEGYARSMKNHILLKKEYEQQSAKSIESNFTPPESN